MDVSVNEINEMLEKPTECLVHVGDHCNIYTPQTKSTLRNPEAGSAYRLSPQSLVSKDTQVKLWGITTHIQAKGSMFP